MNVCLSLTKVNGRVNVWITFKHVPFLYWIVKGICLLGIVLGQLIALSNEAYIAAFTNEPLSEARVLIEMEILDSRPTFLVVSSYVVASKGKVLISYENLNHCGNYTSFGHNRVYEELRNLFSMEDPFEFLSQETVYSANLNLLSGSVSSNFRFDVSENGSSNAEWPALVNPDFIEEYLILDKRCIRVEKDSGEGCGNGCASKASKVRKIADNFDLQVHTKEQVSNELSSRGRKAWNHDKTGWKVMFKSEHMHMNAVGGAKEQHAVMDDGAQGAAIRSREVGVSGEIFGVQNTK